MANKDSEWMTAEEVAEYLTVKPSTVKKWAKLGQIPKGYAGSLLRFNRAEINEWVRNGSTQETAA